MRITKNTEENQDEGEAEVSRDFNLILCGQEALQLLERIYSADESVHPLEIKQLLNRSKQI